MKNNLEHSALPTPDEIRLYHEGKLGPMRSHEIELLAEENPLLAEALEGFTTKPAYHMLPAIQAGVIKASGGVAASGISIAAAAKVASPWWHLNGWWIGVVAGSAAAGGTALIIQSTSSDSAEKKSDNNKANTELSATQNTQPAQESTVAYAAAQDSLTGNLANPVQNHSLPTAVTSDNQELHATRNTGSISNLESVDGTTVDHLNQTASAGGELAPKKSSTVAIGILKVMNYKLADYTALREDNWQKFTLDEIGVSARYQDSEARKKYLSENPGESVGYVDYMTQCIKAYDENKFELAINRFSEVSKQYPDDVNALFYIGMSYYMAGNYASAIDQYKKVEKNFIRTFNEEAYYYHAKSLKKLGLYDEANSFFVKVVQWNGFYKEQAISEMESRD